MCNHFQSSLFGILNQFHSDKPKTFLEVFRGLDSHQIPFVASGFPLTTFLKNLLRDGYLNEKGDGYILSQAGNNWWKELHEIVHAPA